MMSQFAYEPDLSMPTSAPSPKKKARRAANSGRKTAAAIPHFVEEKIKVPEISELIERPRLESLICRSAERFVANLISGRARTGKSAAAAAASRNYKRVAWYTLDLTDSSWPVFANHFAASVLRATEDPAVLQQFESESGQPATDEIARYLVRLLPYTYSRDVGEPMLLVLDDVHHIFDAEWFADFFNFLIYSLPPSVHLLLLARGTPPLPLWRLRSKQLLNVIDENLLSLDRSETETLCAKLGASATDAGRAFESSFGRVGEIINLATAGCRTAA